MTKQNKYRIVRGDRRPEGRPGKYYIQRRGRLFWFHDCGHTIINGKSTYFNYSYPTYRQAVIGVASRHDRDRYLAENTSKTDRKIFYPPFPENEPD